MNRILIVGLGKSGISAAKLLAGSAEVWTWDGKAEDKFDKDMIAQLKALGISCIFEEAPKGPWDMLVLSPGVPPWLDFIEEAKASGAVITGELELAYQICKGTFLAITGTNGKTTTTTLLGEIVKAAGIPCDVAGNIGLPVTEVAAEADESTVMVTEVSSFQLESTSAFKPHVSAILNITPDHLNRHHTMEEYRRVKHLIHKNQDENDYYVFNADDKELAEESLAMDIRAKRVPFSHSLTEAELERYAKGSGIWAFAEDDVIQIRDNGGRRVICPVYALQIPGTHNLENALAAAAMAYCAGINTATIAEQLMTFKGVEHRIEFVREIDGVRYVNDSKGTNPDSTEKAVEATKPGILLIAGGYDKGSDFRHLVSCFNGKVKKLLLLGVTAQKFASDAEAEDFPREDMVFCRDMEECVAKGRELASPGDTVLLSPACASWDMYASYEKRGEHFKNIVNQMV